jgi:hypothetical protein
MALNTAQLKADILDILTDMSQITQDPDAARVEFADRLSAKIELFVKTGTVTVTTVTTCGAGAGTGGGTGTIA